MSKRLDRVCNKILSVCALSIIRRRETTNHFVRNLSYFLTAFASAYVSCVSTGLSQAIPLDRLPPGGVFRAGVPHGIPNNYPEFCDVRKEIPGSSLLAKGDGISDDSTAINAALDLCPKHQFVFLPAGTYRIAHTIRFPSRAVVLRGAGSQEDPAHTELLCDGIGQGVYIDGKMRYGGVIRNIRDGFTVGSTRLGFNSFMDASGLSVGDIILVTEDYDTPLGPTLGGNLESSYGRFARGRYQWNPSGKQASGYYVSAVGGLDPKLEPSKVRQVFIPRFAVMREFLSVGRTTLSLTANGCWRIGTPLDIKRSTSGCREVLIHRLFLHREPTAFRMAASGTIPVLDGGVSIFRLMACMRTRARRFGLLESQARVST